MWIGCVVGRSDGGQVVWLEVGAATDVAVWVAEHAACRAASALISTTSDGSTLVNATVRRPPPKRPVPMRSARDGRGRLG